MFRKMEGRDYEYYSSSSSVAYSSSSSTAYSSSSSTAYSSSSSTAYNSSSSTAAVVQHRKEIIPRVRTTTTYIYIFRALNHALPEADGYCTYVYSRGPKLRVRAYSPRRAMIKMPTTRIGYLYVHAGGNCFY